MADEKEKKKVKCPTAEKRALQNQKCALRNKSFKSEMKTAIRHLETAVSKNEAGSIKEKLNDVFSMLDKGVKKGSVKLNKAARLKSRYQKKVASLSA